MKFFNKKQDVLDIQLTSYGKKKLSIGNFKPIYYCFFDDNVIYDGACAAITEDQNSIQPRILENMQYLKINPTAKGSETKLKERNKEIFEGENDILEIKDYYGDQLQNVEDRETICKYKLANSRLNSQKAPSFEIRSSGAPFVIKTFSNFYTGSGVVQEIPQININLTHLATKMITELSHEKNDQQRYIYPENLDFGDFIIELEGDYLALDFKENNTDYTKENFEFEVFEIVTKENPSGTEDVTEELIPLQLPNKTGYPSTDPADSYVEKYIEILTDMNIPAVFRITLPSINNSENINHDTFLPPDPAGEAKARARRTNTYSGDPQDPEDCS